MAAQHFDISCDRQYGMARTIACAVLPCLLIMTSSLTLLFCGHAWAARTELLLVTGWVSTLFCSLPFCSYVNVLPKSASNLEVLMNRMIACLDSLTSIRLSQVTMPQIQVELCYIMVKERRLLHVLDSSRLRRCCLLTAIENLA